MKFLVLIFLNFFQFLVFANATEKEADIYRITSHQLEKNIDWLIKDHPKKSKILEKFGKPDLIEKNNYYYILDHFKYSLALTIDQENLKYFSYKVPSSSHIYLGDYKSSVQASDLEFYPEDGHDKGKFLKLALKEKKIQLIFSNTSDKQLVRIIYGNK